jgi:hypothetical protein
VSLRIRSVLVIGISLAANLCGSGAAEPSPRQFVGTYVLLSFQSHPLPTSYTVINSPMNGLILLADTLVLGLTSNSWGSASHRMIFEEAGGTQTARDRSGSVWPEGGGKVRLLFGLIPCGSCLPISQPEPEWKGLLDGDVLSIGENYADPPTFRVYRVYRRLY